VQPSASRTAGLTGAALVAFAANSLLCRAALAPRLVDAVSFTGIRLASGAVALAIVARVGAGRSSGPREGSWVSALGLAAYAYAFSFAYLRIGATIGSLVLFGAVQLTMIGWGMVRGERPRPGEIVGLVLAFGGLVALTLPGAHGVDVPGAVLMAAAGAAWGVYSMRGRGARRPIAANADNFLRCLPIVAVLALAFAGRAQIEWRGAALAAASGAVASGIGYSIWYAALPGLRATRAAIVQLAVPVLAAVGAVVLLGETLSVRLVGAGAAILGGVAVAVLGRARS
jgi:drug/metabolite transporter (DMT)-like permease